MVKILFMLFLVIKSLTFQFGPFEGSDLLSPNLSSQPLVQCGFSVCDPLHGKESAKVVGFTCPVLF